MVRYDDVDAQVLSQADALRGADEATVAAEVDRDVPSLHVVGAHQLLRHLGAGQPAAFSEGLIELPGSRRVRRAGIVVDL